MAITTYALQKAGHKDKDNAYTRLQGMARRGNFFLLKSLDVARVLYGVIYRYTVVTKAPGESLEWTNVTKFI